MKDYTMQLRWLQKEIVIPKFTVGNLTHDTARTVQVLQQLVYINGIEQWEDVPTVIEQ